MTPSPVDRDLFDVGPRRKLREFKRQKRPYWTENKARLIERYLRDFLMVTKHGTYIDGFAGPQEEGLDSENWAARLVLGLRPPWLRKFVLIEENPDQVNRLHQMLRRRPPTPLGKRHRNIQVIPGDVNVQLPKYLSDYPIKSTEATFCLLDQRTFECHWSTVETVARHKRAGSKIEIFYFLANFWFKRSMKTTKETSRIDAWWGGTDWPRLFEMSPFDRAREVQTRLAGLGYADVVPYPIYDRLGGRTIMYFMIHASDHPAAPILMRRAYENAVEPLDCDRAVQLELKALGVNL